MLVAAAMGLSISAAQAQSVTLYGRVVAGVDYVDHVATANGQSNDLLRFGSNQWGISMWGLKGDEDLGAGLHAVFNLENMFTAGTGVSDGLFNRYAVVGLSGSSWGTILFGRAMSLTDGEGWAIDPTGMQAMGLETLVYGRNWGPRSNAITFNSANFGGFAFRLQTGLSNEAGNSRANRQMSGSVSYTNGALDVRALYEELRDANGKLSNLYTASREYMIGGSYKIGNAKLYAGYSLIASSGEDTLADAANPTAATRNQMEWIGINYQVGVPLQLIAAVYHANVNHGGGNGTLGVIGADYFLSKRTTLYATFGSMFNGGSAAFPVEVSDVQPQSGRSQQGAYFGVVHYF
ncbi:porin [Paraburkholderia caffeinilytica]|uniref:porin n=1 Tax=Paraburkholderia caffeinilytica TaxID=1761016 RepID=UPI0038BA3DB9